MIFISPTADLSITVGEEETLKNVALKMDQTKRIDPTPDERIFI
jgi:hypothetical protein